MRTGRNGNSATSEGSSYRLAQTGGILIGEANDFREKVVLAKIPYARFHREALAGNILIYDVAVLTLRPEGASVEGKVHQVPTCGGPPDPAQGELIAEAEIFFAHLDQARSQQLFGDHNFVFSGELNPVFQGGRWNKSGIMIVIVALLFVGFLLPRRAPKRENPLEIARSNTLEEVPEEVS